MSIHIDYLKACNFRNFIELEIDPSPSFNILYGDNGSGKTSCLEAIHYLGLGRSFRTRLAPRVITHQQPNLSVFAKIQTKTNSIALGVERQQNGNSKFRIDGEDANTAAKLAEILPLQLIDSNSHNLLIGGPKLRRQFIDWGVFHVEQQFLNAWQDYHRILKQRNAALKQHLAPAQIKAWDEHLAKVGTEIDQQRQKYIQDLLPIFENIWQNLMGEHDIEIIYTKGWAESKTLLTSLEESFSRDMHLNYTCYGIHKADLIFLSNNIPAQDILSRGQQKLLVYALRLAQGKLLQQQTDKACIYLIDDLSTELDQIKRERAAAILLTLESQVFVTGVFESDLKDIFSLPNSRLFHVEHKRVYPVRSC